MKKAYQETLKTCGAKRGWHWLKPGFVAVLEHFVHQSLPKRNDYIHRHHILWAFHPGAGPGINTNPALLGLILATLLTVSWVASLSLPSFKLTNVLFFSVYLSIHEEVPHEGHGLLQRLLLRRGKGMLLLFYGLGSSHHEVCNLVIQAVQRLHS